jgi:hypothetical protein
MEVRTVSLKVPEIDVVDPSGHVYTCPWQMVVSVVIDIAVVNERSISLIKLSQPAVEGNVSL